MYWPKRKLFTLKTERVRETLGIHRRGVMYSFTISVTFFTWIRGEVIWRNCCRIGEETQRLYKRRDKTLRSFYKSELQKVDVREYKEILNSRGQEQNKPHKMVTWLIFFYIVIVNHIKHSNALVHWNIGFTCYVLDMVCGY